MGLIDYKPNITKITIQGPQPKIDIISGNDVTQNKVNNLDFGVNATSKLWDLVKLLISTILQILGGLFILYWSYIFGWSDKTLN